MIAYLKRGEAAGTWLESHFQLQIRIVWWTLLWSTVGVVALIGGFVLLWGSRSSAGGLALMALGGLLLVGAGIWFCYRLFQGWRRLGYRQEA